jgi:hypothetical protein
MSNVPPPGDPSGPPPFPPPGGYAPPGGYGPPGYGGWPGPIDHPQGTTILVLGICSLVICQLLGPVAWVMGNTALREIDAEPGRYAGRGTVQAGRICGIIATVLLALVVAGGLVALLVAAGSSS